MENKITIVIINHSFQINYFSRRWELFAECHPNVEVYLFAPSKYEWYKGGSYTYGTSSIVECSNFDKENYHRRVFQIKEHKFRGWDSPDFRTLLLEIRPNIVYHIGTHNMLSLKQLLKIRNKYLQNTKVIAFSMRGPALNLSLKKDTRNPIKLFARVLLYIYLRNRLSFINENVDAFFCHYPKAVECFRQEGYTGPIYMQTQVGVNEEWFHEDLDKRNKIRNKYNISESTFVFGSATRFTRDKGLDIILEALPVEGDWKYLMMGSGSDADTRRLKDIISRRGLEDKVILTGFVDWYDIACYWNAVDCAIHVPLTTENWEETFSLSAIQPQITKIPVIGSSSGSVPYQIGLNDWVVPEGDISALSNKIQYVLNNREIAKQTGQRMYERAHASFEIRHLNNMFYDTIIEDILTGSYDIAKRDMALYPR